MMKTKHLIGDVEINRDLVLLLTIGGLYTLAISLSNTFVNIYIWKQTKDFLNIGLYNLAVVIAQPITFACAGKLAKNVDRIIILRLGMSALAAFFYYGFMDWNKCLTIYFTHRKHAWNWLWVLLARI
jgi:YQGE family putative transporter